MQHRRRAGMIKHLALIGTATVTSLFAYHYAASASVGPDSEAASGLKDFFDAPLGGPGEYRLNRLALLERTLLFVDDKYVEPERIDREAMFDAALDTVERRVPEVLFNRATEGELLHVAVGNYTTTLELPAIDTTSKLMDQLARVASILQENLSDEVELPEIEYSLINGMLSTLDPHSILLPPEQSKEMDVDNAGAFGGLGITITVKEGRLTIEYPLQDTPAHRAGLKPDDQITRIEGESTINMDLNDAVSRLRGRVGEPVVITVRRDSWDKDRDITIVRDRIKINPVEGQLLEGGVAYVKIKNFHAEVSADLRDELTRMRRKHGSELRGLILDLRDNPGGYLHQAVGVSDLFLDRDTIVSTVERGNRRVESKKATRDGTEPKYSMVVLTNANSASASEIVAGALANSGRAVVIGERSFGKGSVQNLYKNGDDSQLKLTVAKYLTSGEQSIQSVGVPADIQLEPSIVDVRVNEETGREDPVVAMYYRERVQREADLGRHLDRVSKAGGEAVYTVRYLAELDDDGPRTGETPDLSQDWYVNFGRDALLAAPERSNRAQLLASVGGVVSNHRKREATHINQAFSKFDIDWTPGEQPATPSLQVEVDLGEDQVVTAGESNEEMIQVHVTNTGDAAVHQVMAVSESEFPLMDGAEFFFGRIDPGETRSWSRRISLPEGYRDEVERVRIQVKDAQRTELASHEHLIRSVGQPLPAFSWTTELLDGTEHGARGDGDGVAEPGETVALRVMVTNVGEGPAGAAYARLKNKAYKDLDLQVGIVELEEIAPGATAEGSFIFQVRGSGAELPVDLTVGDKERYDYAAVWRGAFYDASAEQVSLAIPVGAPMAAGSYQPPTLEVTRSPSLMEAASQAVISGVARDDGGVRDVQVFWRAGEESEKVYYQGGDEGVTMMPFSVDVTLQPGKNLFVIQTRDGEGLQEVRSINVWYDDTGVASKQAASVPLGG